MHFFFGDWDAEVESISSSQHAWLTCCHCFPIYNTCVFFLKISAQHFLLLCALRALRPYFRDTPYESFVFLTQTHLRLPSDDAHECLRNEGRNESLSNLIIFGIWVLRGCLHFTFSEVHKFWIGWWIVGSVSEFHKVINDCPGHQTPRLPGLHLGNVLASVRERNVSTSEPGIRLLSDTKFSSFCANR